MKKIFKKMTCLFAFSVLVVIISVALKTKMASAACNHKWSPAGCFRGEICEYCHTERGDALGHSWIDATCTEPKTCSRCKSTEGEKLGHNFSTASCTTSAECNRCGLVLVKAQGHDWAAATCSAAQTCKRYGCHATQGTALGHSWDTTICTSKKTCTRCKTTSVAGQHSWIEATCTSLKTCSKCGTTTGSKEAHTYSEATTTKKATCTQCGATKGSLVGIIVKFNANGGMMGNGGDGVPPITVTYGNKYGDLPAKPTRPGYTFGGWYTKKSGGTKVTSGTKVSLTDDHTLYAHWSVNEYTIVFKGNGATSGSMDGITTKYNSSVTLPANGFKKTGYSFAGWATNKDGTGTIYKNKAKVSKLTSLNGGKFTLYAKWTANTYQVTFDANGGMMGNGGDGVPPITVTYGKKYGNLPVQPTRTGYTFNGWYTAKSGGTKITSDDKVSLTNDHTLYAHWTVNEYTIVFNGNGATSGSTNSITTTYNSSVSLSANGFKKTGYSFAGWATNKDGTGTSYKNKAEVSKLTSVDGGTFTLYAKWTANKYAVSFDANGGKMGNGGDGIPPITVTYGKKYGNLPAGPTKTGYTFNGWYTSDGTRIKSDDKVSLAGDHTLKAHWAEHKYIIAFEGNGATSGSMDEITAEYSSGVTLPANGFKKTGYSFAGWSTNKDGTGTNYKNKAEVSKLTSVKNGTVTLYAQWTANKYTVTYNANGGSIGTSKAETVDKTVTYGQAYVFPGGTPRRTGYTFDGWYTAKNGGTKVESGTKVERTADHTLYAHWTINAYEITFDANGGSGAPQTQTAYVGKQTKLSGNEPTRKGYVFMGWSLLQELPTDVHQPEEMFPKDSSLYIDISNTKDVTLYAIWEQAVYSVEFDADGGTVESTPDRFLYGSKLVMPKASKDGFVFLGWSNSSDSDGEIVYNVGDEIEVTSNMKLYACWAKKERTITYKLNDGTDKTVYEQTVNFGDTIDIITLVPERRFYKFLGWSLDQYDIAPTHSYIEPYAGNTKFPNEDDPYYEQYKDDEDITFHAVWQMIADGEMITGLQNTYGKSNLPDEIFLKEYESTEWIKLSNDAYAVVKTSKDEFGVCFSTIFVIEKEGDEIKFNVYGSDMDMSTAFELHILEEHSDWLGVTIVSAGRVLKEVIKTAADAAVTVVFPGGKVILLTRDLISMVDDFRSMWDTIKDSYEEYEDMISEKGQITVNGNIELGPEAWDMLGKIIENVSFEEVFEVADDSAEKLFSMNDYAGLVLDLIEFWSLMGRSCYENVDPNGGLDEVAGYYIELLENAGFSQSVTSEVGSVLTNLYNVTVAPVESL